ncbi:MAG TPA: hypothetical protein PK509_12560 [Catalimonadaceae bacterium]|nr:hypothetical protein [Catalimonadaceae bacterium]
MSKILFINKVEDLTTMLKFRTEELEILNRKKSNILWNVKMASGSSDELSEAIANTNADINSIDAMLPHIINPRLQKSEDLKKRKLILKLEGLTDKKDGDNTLDAAEDEFQLEDADNRIAFITSKITEINARIAEIQSQTPGTV